MELVLIGNKKARAGRRLPEALEALRRHATVEDRLLDEPAQLPDAIRAAVADGFRRIVVAGGDGTVVAAVQELAHTEHELALVPLGTQNNFAHSLHIPTAPEEAAELAATGRALPVDVGRADDSYFANAVTIGLSSRIARQTPHGLKRALGQVAYGLVGLRLLATTPAFTCTLRTPDAERTLRTHQLVIANGRRIGDAVTAPGASSRDGMLDVTSLGDGTRRSLLAGWWAFRNGRHGDVDDAVLLRTPEISVSTSPRQRIDIDGEVAQRTPARFWVEPGALRAVVP